ncbi:hypothetical protein FACS1894110_26710 [Spirochaetia bacterium]|nr:hypothetical protein FACS1894110_26710 [Spirochaetia bacterium]
MSDSEGLTEAGVYSRSVAAKYPHRAITSSNGRRKYAPGRKPYTPQFSEMATVSVRRLAWAMGAKVQMPAAVDLMVRLLPSIVDPAKVCLSCQDNSKCQGCVFCTTLTPEEKAALLAAL